MSTEGAGKLHVLAGAAWPGDRGRAGPAGPLPVSRGRWVFSHTCMGQASILKTKPRDSGRAECRKVSCLISPTSLAGTVSSGCRRSHFGKVQKLYPTVHTGLRGPAVVYFLSPQF